jgi:diguanylate cyclase (GGDEF)-like protein/PAS domain S-box-containing protein
MSDLDASTTAWLAEQLQEALRAAARLAGTMAGNVARVATNLETLLDPGRTAVPAATPTAGTAMGSARVSGPDRPLEAMDPDNLERLVGLLNRAADVVMVLDADATVVYANGAVERSLGYARSEIIGTTGLEILHPDDVPVITGTLGTLLLRPGGSATFDYRVKHKDGSWRWFESIAMNWLDDPEIQGLVVNARDVSERRQYEDDLRHRALHDSLTGLPNRALLSDRLASAISRSGRDANSVAVFFVDLDDFKSVNDTHGHGAGDDVLVGAAKRLDAAARAEDTVARYGGDEFVVVLEHDQEPEWVNTFAERLRGIFSRPIQAGASMATVTASIGIAISNGNQTNPEVLLRDADAAMYRAKQNGGDAFVLFDDSMLDEPVIDLAEADRSMGENVR